jgi:hypothetical protein
MSREISKHSTSVQQQRLLASIVKSSSTLVPRQSVQLQRVPSCWLRMPAASMRAVAQLCLAQRCFRPSLQRSCSHSAKQEASNVAGQAVAAATPAVEIDVRGSNNDDMRNHAAPAAAAGATA